VVVEIDGWVAHSGKQSFVDDRRRQNRLVRAGYTVLRFTWWDLIHDLDDAERADRSPATARPVCRSGEYRTSL